MSDLILPGFESSGAAPISGLGSSTLGQVDWRGSLFAPGLGGLAREGLMSDLELLFRDELGEGDLAIDEGGDLVLEQGLGTAVLLSLFSDRRAEPDDELPDSATDPRGWWGDAIALVDGDRIGSRLWLLHRAKATGETRARAEEYAREALEWLVEDGIAAGLAVVATFVRDGSDTSLRIDVEITRPGGIVLQGAFSYVWGA